MMCIDFQLFIANINVIFIIRVLQMIMSPSRYSLIRGVAASHIRYRFSLQLMKYKSFSIPNYLFLKYTYQ